MPLVISLKDINQVTQIFYADDGLGGGTLASVNQWWDKIKLKGPEYGYLPNPGKSWVSVKPHLEDEAKALFPDVNITTEGQRYLGSYIGTKEGQDKFVKKEVEKWAAEITSLAEIANMRFLIMRTACAQIRAFHAHHTSRATNFNSKLEFARLRFAFLKIGLNSNWRRFRRSAFQKSGCLSLLTIRSFGARDGLGLTVRVWLGFGSRGRLGLSIL
eukprot:sb/3470029/